MKITLLNAEQLQTFIYSDEYEQMPEIPISRHRALSQIKNPRVKPNDILLLLCHIDNKMVGYLGVLPDHLHLDKTERAGWLSCLWVDTEVRGKGIAKTLLKQAYDAWQGNLLITEFTPVAKSLYDRSEMFTDLSMQPGLRCYMRFNSHRLLPQKNKIFAKIKSLFQVIDHIGNAINDRRLTLQTNRFRPDNISYEPVSEVDEEIWKFISSRQSDELTRREKDELNWIIQNPWLLTERDEFTDRYIFSSYAKELEVINLKLYGKNSKSMVGYMMLTVRDGRMKTPYFYIDKGYIKEAADLIIHLMLKMSANMVTTFQPELVSHWNKFRHPFLHVRQQQRHYIITKNLVKEQSLTNIQIQDGEGDAAFT